MAAVLLRVSFFATVAMGAVSKSSTSIGSLSTLSALRNPQHDWFSAASELGHAHGKSLCLIHVHIESRIIQFRMRLQREMVENYYLADARNHSIQRGVIEMIGQGTPRSEQDVCIPLQSLHGISRVTAPNCKRTRILDEELN